MADELVVRHVRELIIRGKFRPGQRLPTERELVQDIGVSRTSVRAGLQTLAAKGLLVIRHGAGTFVADGPPVLDSEPLSLLAALARVHPQADVRGAPHARSQHRAHGRRARDRRAARGDLGRGQRDVRDLRRPAGVSGAGHPVSRRGRHRVRQSDPGVGGRDDLGDVLRAAAADGRSPAAICGLSPTCIGTSIRPSATASPGARPIS